LDFFTSILNGFSIHPKLLSPVLECTCGYDTGTIAILILILEPHNYQHLATLGFQMNGGTEISTTKHNETQ